MMQASPTHQNIPPMTVTQVIERTVAVYRDHFVQFIGMVAIVLVPLTVANLILTSDASAALTEMPDGTLQFDIPPDFWLSVIITIVTLVIQGIVINGVITYVTSEYYLGRRISIGEALSAASGRMGTLALGMIVLGLVAVAAVFVVSLLSAFCGLFVLLMPILFYLVMTTYFFIVPVLILERVDVGLGMARALKLGKARFWPTIGVLVIILVIAIILSTIMGIFTGLFDAGTEPGSISLVGIMANIIVNIVIAPILPIALTIMYYDARVRTENLNAAFATVDKADPRPADVASPQPSDRLITGQDIGNIAVLIIGFFAFGLILSLILGVAVGASP